LDQIQTERDLEFFLRDAGRFSKSLAQAVASRARTIFRRDAETDAQEIAEATLQLRARLNRIARLTA
ncbi:MAG: hypothetical protein KBH41_19905, partial [Azonexus sp.]|nr:hypothetical protein [Azonexus sp.]